MAKAKIFEFTDEEKDIFVQLYTQYLTQNPNGSEEDFVSEKCATSKGYLFAKKFNKEITPWQYFQSLSPINRKEIFDKWSAEATQNIPAAPKEKNIAEIIKEENLPKQAPASPKTQDGEKEKELFEQKMALRQQLESISRFDRAETSGSMQRKKQQWIKIASEEETNELQLLLPENYVQSDQVLDMVNDKRVTIFSDNLPEFASDFNNADLKGADKLKMRQKLVDFIRFVESGRKSRENLQTNNWKFLRSDYVHFPRMPAEILFTIYNNEITKNEKSDRAAMLQRTVSYLFENIAQGKRNIEKPEELSELEGFIEKQKNLAFATALKGLFEQIKQKYDAQQKAEKQETLEKPVIINEDSENKEIKPFTPEPSKKIEEKQKAKATIIHEITNDDEHKESLKDKSEDEKTAAAKAAESLTKDDKPESLAETTSKEDDSWKVELWSSWENWGKDNNKIVAQYTNDEHKKSLSFKIYHNLEDQKKDLYDADIVYHTPHEVTVKGCDDKIPDLKTFEQIIKQAKKNSPEIEFGNIKNPEFKAKLLLSCLNDPEIIIIKQPKLEELKGISDELYKALELKLPSIEVKEKESAQTNLESKNNKEEKALSKPKSAEKVKEEKHPSKREFTPEETAAYLERKKRREASGGDKPSSKRVFTPEETAAYLERKKRRENRSS